MDNNKALHRALRRLAGWGVWSFFSNVHVVGAENVPRDGPMIVCVFFLIFLVFLGFVVWSVFYEGYVFFADSDCDSDCGFGFDFG